MSSGAPAVPVGANAGHALTMIICPAIERECRISECSGGIGRNIMPLFSLYLQKQYRGAVFI